MTDKINNKRKRKRKSKNKNKRIEYSNAFVWEYAFESITEGRTKFRRNMPEYE